jgi:diguanylate cyclase (GGDEF)-like protein
VENTVVGMKEAVDGQIWIATRNGISILDPITNTIINLSLSDGIGGYTFTGEGFKDADGSLFFGGTHGVTRFPSRTGLGNNPLPPVYITNFLVYQTPVAVGSIIYNNRNYELKSDENFIGFEYNAIDYQTLSHIQYSYKLSGVDEEWVESGNRNYVSYSNLSAGKYTFSVRVKTIQGVYTEPASVTFTISKPWYSSYYAYVFYAFIFGFIVYSLIKIRENKLITSKNSELEVINDKLEDAVKKLEEVSIKDALTGIFNRRYFNEVLEDHLQLAIRSQNAISLLMIDVDDFKNINDKYGHVFGDRFLIEFARRISDNLPRSTDFCARYGGDEFAVVLYDTDSKGAMKIANSIKDSLEVLNISFQNEMVEIQTFVSIGIYSIVPDKDASIEALVSIADEALYDAKKTGKNKIVLRDQTNPMG